MAAASISSPRTLPQQFVEDGAVQAAPPVIARDLVARPAQLAVSRLLEAGVSLSEVSEALRMDRSTLYRLLRRERLRYDVADRVAVAPGRHPVELWPESFGDQDGEVQP